MNEPASSAPAPETLIIESTVAIQDHQICHVAFSKPSSHTIMSRFQPPDLKHVRISVPCYSLHMLTPQQAYILEVQLDSILLGIRSCMQWFQCNSLHPITAEDMQIFLASLCKPCREPAATADYRWLLIICIAMQLYATSASRAQGALGQGAGDSSVVFLSSQTLSGYTTYRASLAAETRDSLQYTVMHHVDCIAEYDNVAVVPQCPEDVSRMLPSPSLWWNPVSIHMMVDTKWFGSVMVKPTIVGWGRQEVIFNQRSCNTQHEAARAEALMPFASSANRMKSSFPRIHRGGMQVAVGLAMLNYSQPASVPAAAALAAANVVQLLHTSGWASLPRLGQAEVWKEDWQGNNMSVGVDGMGDPGLWFSSPNKTKVLSDMPHPFSSLASLVATNLQQICPIQMSQAENKPPVDISTSILHQVGSLLGLPKSKRREVINGCGMSAKVGWVSKPRTPLFIAAPVKSPLTERLNGVWGAPFCASSRWGRLRSVVLAAHGAFHTVPSMPKHLEPGKATSVQFMGVATVVVLAPGLTAAQLSVVETVFSLFSRKYEADGEVMVFRTGVLKTKHAASIVKHAARADVVVMMDAQALLGLLALPPWGAVLEVLPDDDSVDPSGANEMASLLGVDHALIELPRVWAGEFFTDDLMRLVTVLSRVAIQAVARRARWLEETQT